MKGQQQDIRSDDPTMNLPSSWTCRFVCCAALLASLCGCAVPTTAAFDARVAGLIGRPEAEIVAQLGVPVRTHEAGGQRFLQYESRRLVGYPGAYPPGFGFGYGGYRYGGYGGFGGFGGYGAFPTVESRECDLTIAFRDGRAEGFSRRGSDCRALLPTVG